MTQEEKDLLLKDLCARLPYRVKCLVNYTFCNETTDYKDVKDSDVDTLIMINQQSESYFFDWLSEWFVVDDFKPYLFPLSSMTDEMWDKEFREYGITEFTRDSFKYGCETLEFNNSNPNLSNTIQFINQLIKNHFDIYGLIPKGLAIDATGLNIY